MAGFETSTFRWVETSTEGSIATYTRNVKRWQGGSMIMRWASAAVLDAKQRFRRIRGHRDLARLVKALEEIETKQNNAMDQRVA